MGAGPFSTYKHMSVEPQRKTRATETQAAAVGTPLLLLLTLILLRRPELEQNWKKHKFTFQRYFVNIEPCVVTLA